MNTTLAVHVPCCFVCQFVFAHCVDRDGKRGQAATNLQLWGQRFVVDVIEKKKSQVTRPPAGTLDLQKANC